MGQHVFLWENIRHYMIQIKVRQGEQGRNIEDPLTDCPTMPPKRRAATDRLSQAEQELLAIAVRLNEAVNYREVHKEEVDELWYIQCIENELVRHPF